VGKSIKGHIEIFYKTKWVEKSIKGHIGEINMLLHCPNRSQKRKNGKRKASALPEKESKEEKR